MEGTLYYLRKTDGPVRVIKEDEKMVLLRGCHNGVTACGHQGIDRTLTNISDRYYWPGISNDIKEHVRKGPQCHQNQIHKESSTLHPIPVKSQVLSIVGLDLVGPLKTTTNGNRFVAVLTNCYEVARSQGIKDQVCLGSLRFYNGGYLQTWGTRNKIDR